MTAKIDAHAAGEPAALRLPLRVDYVLPRKHMRIVDAAVFWPTSGDPLFDLVGTFPFPSSDHRLVWIDVRLPAALDVLAHGDIPAP